MPNILFVCSANRFRSVLAAECFRSLLENQLKADDYVVGSAGIWAMQGLAPIKEALQWAANKHINIESVRSREITTALVNEADLIIVMADGQREAIILEFPQAKKKIVLLSEITVGQTYDIPDPVTAGDEDPQQIAEEIYSLVDAGFSRILDRAAG